VLHVKSEQLGETVVLRCAGRIVRGYETALLCAAVSQRTQNLILDLSKVDAIDAAGIGALVSLQAAGIYLQLMDPTKAVREVLRVTGLESVFEIVRSLPTAKGKEKQNGARSEKPTGSLLLPLTAI
jgi:anti-anti-sigma factor